MQIFCHKVAPKFVDKYKKHIKYLKNKKQKLIIILQNDMLI